mgnify:CR=1 FL=1
MGEQKVGKPGGRNAYSRGIDSWILRTGAKAIQPLERRYDVKLEPARAQARQDVAPGDRLGLNNWWKAR